MPDEMDLVGRHNEEFQAYALKHQRVSREPANYTGIYCLDCDEEIPIKRRQAQPGCRRCIDCQEAFELETTG